MTTITPLSQVHIELKCITVLADLSKGRGQYLKRRKRRISHSLLIFLQRKSQLHMRKMDMNDFWKQQYGLISSVKKVQAGLM